MSNEKKFEMTSDQKNLTWQKFIQPQKGTKADADHFIEVCETFGLNPLMGDIVFQRYKSGQTSHIITRDGLLRVASEDPNYTGPPNAAVVKEGDHFEFLPSEGKVEHRFGQKRGKIIGAYAVLNHKKFNSVATFVDFPEYYKANSGRLNSYSGKDNVWDKMPSAMIQKVAEVFVLRRAFPLNGLNTREEMELEEQPEDEKQQNTGNPVPEFQAQNNSKKFISKEGNYALDRIVGKITRVRGVSRETVFESLGKPLHKIESSEFESCKRLLLSWLSKAEKAAGEKITSNDPSVKTVNEEDKGNVYSITELKRVKSPSGKDMVKINTKELKKTIFCRDINEASVLMKDGQFTGHIVDENGFPILKEVYDVIA